MLVKRIENPVWLQASVKQNSEFFFRNFSEKIFFFSFFGPPAAARFRGDLLNRLGVNSALTYELRENKTLASLWNADAQSGHRRSIEYLFLYRCCTQMVEATHLPMGQPHMCVWLVNGVTANQAQMFSNHESRLPSVLSRMICNSSIKFRHAHLCDFVWSSTKRCRYENVIKFRNLKLVERHH